MVKDTKQPKKTHRRDAPRSLQHMTEQIKNEFEFRIPKTGGTAHTSNPTCGILQFDIEGSDMEQVPMTNENYQTAPSKLEAMASMRHGRTSHGDVQHPTLAFDPAHPARTHHRRNNPQTEMIETSMPHHWRGLQSPQNSDHTPTSAGVSSAYPFYSGVLDQQLLYGVDQADSSQLVPFLQSPISQQPYWSGQTNTHLYDDYPLQNHFPDLYTTNSYPSTSGSHLSNGPEMAVSNSERPFLYRPGVVPDHLLEYAEGSNRDPAYPPFDTVQGPQY